MSKKVSIITPCYNGEEYISRFLDSILCQSYTNIELILVNDGSTDNTENIIKSYISKFEQKQIPIKYLCQENAGQAAALNNGLKEFTGDYLTWPDSDDMLSIHSIKKKVEYLEEYKEYAIVRSDAFIVNEKDLNKIKGYIARNNDNKFKEELFLDYLIENKVWFAPGCFMVRSTSFLDVNPCKEIYTGIGGQNWQMLLPIMYRFKCGYIDEALYTYVVRDNSHSHKQLNFNENLKRCYQHENILMNTLDSINMSESQKELYEVIVREKYIRKRFYLAIQHNEKISAKKEYLYLKSNYSISFRDTLVYLIGKNKFFSWANKLFLEMFGKSKYLIKYILKI